MKKQTVKEPGINTKEIIISGICAYIAGICSLPSSGLLSTLPAAAVLSVIASFFCKNKVYIYSLMGIMPLLLNCLFDFGIKRAVASAIVFIASSVFAILLTNFYHYTISINFLFTFLYFYINIS